MVKQSRNVWLVAIVMVFLAGCSSLGLNLQKPDIHLTSIKALPANGLEQRFLLGLKVINPNGVSLPVSGLSYSLSLRGHQILSGATPSFEEVPAFSAIQLELESGTSLIGALRVMGDLLSNPEQPFSYELSVKISSQAWFVPLEIIESGEISLE